MADVAAISAASVIVLRDAPLEVLMLRRHANASFAPNAWVFPGGVVDPSDTRESTLATMRVTAARELFEETGISLGAPLARDAAFQVPDTLEERLVWTSHWITPVGVPRRFDTYFFVTSVSRETEASLLGDELLDLRWIAPADALASLQMIFPTVKNLEALQPFTTAADFIASRRGATIEAIQPVLVGGRPTLP